MKSMEVQVAGLTIDPATKMPVVVLRDEAGTLQIPIWIGLVEASAIATQLEKVQLARPMTHDLMKTVLETTGTKLEKIEITELRDDTFFAAMHMRVAGKPVVLDSRPSDAIALALRTGARIFVAPQVLEATRRADEGADVKAAGRRERERDREREREIENEVQERPRVADLLATNPPAKWAEILESLSPEDFGKFKM